MTPSVAAETGPQREAALASLLEHEPFLDYANFRPLAVRPGASVALHAGRWREPDAIAVLVARDDAGRPLGALCLRPRPFESDHFGLRMARIDPPAAVEEAAGRLVALRALYRDACSLLREQGFQHVAARVSTHDRVGGWTLQEVGARHVDTQVSWMCPLSGERVESELAPGLRLEICERDAVKSVAPADWRRLAEWGARGFDRGPLVFDLTLDADRARDVYRAWTERVMTGEWSDAVLLVREGREVVSFISMLELPDVSAAAGERVCGRGLGATLPGYRGLFTAIQREMIAVRPLGAEWMENETQVSTVPSINVYARLGFRYLRSTSSFHLRLDGVEAA